MSMAPDMAVIIRLPTRTLFEGRAAYLGGVAPDGAFGLLPNHVDFVTAIVPSVLTLRMSDGTDEIFGLDEGLLVKKGHKVAVVVLRGVRGDDLVTLQDTVAASFIQMDEEERQARAALSRLEADMVRRFAELKGPFS
ncbi:ATPase [Yoonia sediminilitoris]|uniref:F-type H+-transporting ATPase subunit epsilon n=1 Tax=Yoonia sediminilitoris TaxID=1286148 RepID=A0A2T6KJQ2_9RHOB|nr:ATPase [Yoonia sediminilitoris]PUB16194.1 F-type H+-transporting ATPase subunit epsilon [Yoonia sediminilitoris]RCW96543.1 F-type H+-transporting ATPase subunit epsilon [Yoonia sediminilitoris]